MSLDASQNALETAPFEDARPGLLSRLLGDWQPSHWALLLIVGFVALPLLALFYIALHPSGDVWPHLVRTVLPRATATTAWLMLGVGSLAALIGVTTAWLVTMYDFRGRKVLELLLLIPLAMPTYIVAYCYVELLDYTGPVQSTLRALFGFKSAKDYWFPDIRSLWGGIFVISLVLYPYVYLTTRAAFLMQSACTLQVSRTLGATPWRMFTRVGLPLARPAIAVGVTLVLMECVNDIGAVEFFGINTLTVSVYATWLNRNSLEGAAQIAIIMLAVIFLLIWIERRARQHQRFDVTTRRYQPLPASRLSPRLTFLAWGYCLLPILFGFVFPTSIMVQYALRRLEDLENPAVVSAIANSLMLAAGAAALTVFFGLFIAIVLRGKTSPLLRFLARLSAVGYAVPGTILAVGILIPLSGADSLLNNALKAFGYSSVGLVFSGSAFAMLYAYTVRFMAVSAGAIETGLGKISPHLDMAARTLGRSPIKAFIVIQLPLIRPALVSAALLVFVDTMKELPATILLRPFNFDTLSTFVYNAASREVFPEGAVAALFIVISGIIPVVLLARTSAQTFRRR